MAPAGLHRVFLILLAVAGLALAARESVAAQAGCKGGVLYLNGQFRGWYCTTSGCTNQCFDPQSPSGGGNGGTQDCLCNYAQALTCGKYLTWVRMNGEIVYLVEGCEGPCQPQNCLEGPNEDLGGGMSLHLCSCQ